MHALDFATVDDEGVALATVVTEHWGCVEGEVEGGGESAGGIGEEVDLEVSRNVRWDVHLLWGNGGREERGQWRGNRKFEVVRDRMGYGGQNVVFAMFGEV